MKKLILHLLVLHLACIAQSQAWTITGNANINPANHFLGTTNNQPLKFRINNQYAGEIDSINSKTFFGYGAGKNTTGAGNVAIGFKALNANTTGFVNTAVGADALHFNTTGTFNTATGNTALYSNTTGSANTAMGFQALWNNSTGASNTATGYYSLAANTTGNFNTANGQYALLSNSTGSYNTAMGYSALANNTSGLYNMAAGTGALYSNTTGTYNAANGYQALYSNTTGTFNTANGYRALFSNTTGYYNTANGARALHFNTTGNSNTANGTDALNENTTGYDNTANGFNALLHNSTGTYNTSIGSNALYNATTANYNTAIGYRAGDSYNLGWNNTILGAYCDGSFAGQYNIIAIGQGVICPDNSTVRIGNSATWSIGGYAGWTNFSDGRYKKNVRENVKGLEFIMKLRPVTYNLDISGASKKSKENGGNEWDERMKGAIADKENAVFTGFVAQEVEQAAKETGFDFSGVDKPRNENGFYGLRYADFVVPLVKAIQEQQQIISDLQKRIVELEKRSVATGFTPDNTASTLNVWPNPANENLIINIVADSKSQAAIKLFDYKGALVKQLQLTLLQGNNQFNIDLKGLANGTYHLSVEWNNGQVKKTTQVIKQ